MKKKTLLTIICSLLLVVLLIGTLSSCRKAERVAYNVSKEADYFNVTRRLAVINARTDTPIFELVGNFSVRNNTANELEIICEVAPNEYKKHLIYLNEWTLYVIEDVSGAEVSPYHYEVNFLPEMFVPFTITTND